MNSEVKVFTRENGEIQRVQTVRLDDWSQLDFLYLKQESFEEQIKALQCFCDIYKNYLVPFCPWIFPQMVMFCLPEDMDISTYVEGTVESISEEEERFIYDNNRYGKVTDSLTIATILLQEGIQLKGKKPIFKNEMAEKLYKELDARGCVRIVCGKFPKTKMIPVGRFAGYLSKVEMDAKL